MIRMLPLLLLLLPFGAWGPYLAAQGEDDGEDGRPRMSEEYRKRYTLDPEKQDPRQVKFGKLYLAGRYDEAMPILREWLSEDPKDVGAAVTLANMYWDLGQFSQAEEWYKRALEMVPRHVEAPKWLGRMYLHRGRFSEARELFEKLVEREKLRPDIRGSSELNLGKLALIRRDFRAADRYFFNAGRSPRKGHRNMARKGRHLTARLKKTRLWNHTKTRNLHWYFSPEIPQARDEAARKAWAAKRQTVFDRMCKQLDLSFEETWTCYAFKSDADANAITGQDLPTWKYSWWLVATAWDRDAGFDLALQLAARVAGARPRSKPMVVGLACYLDDDAGDPHAAAREELGEGRLVTFADAHKSQRYDLQEARLYGESFVAWLIGTYGMERFLESYKVLNVVLLDPAWVHPTTRTIDWDRALSGVFRRGIGEDYPSLEARWMEFLRRG